MKPIRTVKLKIGKRPVSQEPNPPFIVEDYATKGQVPIDPMSTNVPLNRELMKKGAELRKKFPELLEGRMTAMREFFLTELAPILLASSNGLEDAGEILKNALEEDVDVRPYFTRLERMLDVALEVRMADFICQFAGLSAPQRKVLTYLLFSKDTSNGLPISKILSAMQSLPDLQGQTKGATLPVRKVHTTKRSRVHTRT